MEQLVNFIIRPPRADYTPKNDLLEKEFTLKGQWFVRKDLEVTNSRGNVLQCSHYMPLFIPEGKTLPCVIYCHGNSGCRADASEAAIILLPSYITVFTLDFSGSGLSEGEHVTLGWNEKDDLKAVVNYLRADGNVSCIGLWGRSMGAVTSLMYGVEDPSIAGMVLDSPFSNLVDLMMELVDTYKFRLPKFTVKFAIQYMRKAIQKKAKFDIMELNTIEVAKCCFVPVLLGHAIDDDFIRPHHSDRIYDSYVGDKNIIKFDGDHNSPRPKFYFDSITIFFHNVLQPPKDVLEGNYFQSVNDYFDKDSWDVMHGASSMKHSSREPSQGLNTSSTEADINQLRSRRPMSQTVVPSNIPLQGKQFGAEEKCSEPNLGSTSSGLITLDLSNGHPCGPLIPTAVEDDQYVEYSFESLSDFPINMEDEERMFMEAVLESLKNLEIRHPYEGDQLPNGETISSSSSHKDGPEPSSMECTGPTKTAVIYAPASSGNDLIHEHPPPCAALSNGHTFDNAPSSCSELESGRNPTKSDESTSSHSSANDDSSAHGGTDVSGSTRTTLKVQKNPASHIIEGLAHRWGLNLFRNSG
eukprot:TRINITY_DN19716_c0_g1_i1.p1 TRINITY_DN19716_c0_g1~~TRINITY_DN19716_c0_g1_i1.p1  ORF type:complete len:582 (-),score=83.89 TRINITY_DN19716_c0_g1_i1:490-2235(-)